MGAIKETYFISHGSPRICIEESFDANDFLKKFKENVLMNQRPKAILLISAHWDTSEPTVNAIYGRHSTIHDLDPHIPTSMFKLEYPAPGAPELAARVKQLLIASGFDNVREDNDRGLDHGAWVPLMLIYPEADIPVSQLSIQTKRDATYHYNMGRSLETLKNEGILIIGSGSATHNKWTTLKDTSTIPAWALQFDTWLKQSLLSGRYEDVMQFEEKAPYAKTAHASPDHMYPLHVVMGAAGENSKAELLHESWSNSSLSYASYKFVSVD